MTITEFKALPKPRRKPVQRESQLQQSCIIWFRSQYPQYADLLYAIPNAGKTTSKVSKNGKRYSPQGARFKAEGLIPGFPDLGLAVAKKGYHGMYIEMKAEKGSLSDKQIRILDALRLQGYYIRVPKSLQAFQLAVKQYLS